MCLIDVRAGVPADAAALLQLSQDAIRESARAEYTAAELAAWCARLTLADHTALLAQATVLVAESAGTPAGWACVIAAAHELDRLYVAPTLGGRGVARTLLVVADEAARAAGCTVLDTRASLRAAPVFAAAGYARVADEVVVLDGQRLRRVHMRKDL